MPNFPNASYSDADGDGLKNHEDIYPLDPTNNDADSDGIDDASDPVLNDSANPSSYNNTSWYSDALGDIDGDYNLNFYDDTPWGNPGDADSDGIPNENDPAPNDYNNTSSVNGISWYGSALGDDDTDGTLNFYDSFPYTISDSDSDGLTDNIDPAPNDSTNTSPTNNIIWNSYALGDEDTDGTANFHDPTPYPPEDADADGYNDNIDPAPSDFSNLSSYNQQMWYSDALGDSDYDGTLNFYDYNPWGDPPPADNDTDGLNFNDEANLGTSDSDPDSDDDGLTDGEEVHIHSTSPTNKFFLSQQFNWGDLYTDYQLVDLTDSDADTIPDRVEQHYANYGLNTSDAADSWRDMDSNGINNRTQYAMGMALDYHLGSYDEDDDGISDVFEDYYQLNKQIFDDAVADADGDGVSNYEEMVLVLNPHDPDTHDTGSSLGDLLVLMTRLLYPDQSIPAPTEDTNTNGIPDWADAALASPQSAQSFHFTRATPDDLDGDGLPDAWEHEFGRWRYTNGVQMRVADADADLDTDGLTSAWEHALGTSPVAGDSNANDIPDGQEDPDNDGLSNYSEILLGTDPLVADIAIQATALPTAYVNAAYLKTFQAVHAPNTSVTWSIAQGNLPPGLQFDSSGMISGTVDGNAIPGDWPFEVMITESRGFQTTRPFILTVSAELAPLTILEVPDLEVQTGHALSHHLEVTGGSGVYSDWSLSNGSLPYGLGFDPVSGLLSGPVGADPGEYIFEVSISDDMQHTASMQITVTVLPPPPVPPPAFVTDPNLPDAISGATYTYTLGVSGGTAPLVFTKPPGDVLPAGLSLSTSGVISGTAPTDAAQQVYEFQVWVEDALGRTDTRTFTLGLRTSAFGFTSPLPLIPIHYPMGGGGRSFQFAVSSPYTPPLSFSLAPGSSLPAGITITSAGIYQDGGQPLAMNFSFDLTASDASGRHATARFVVQTYDPLNGTPIGGQLLPGGGGPGGGGPGGPGGLTPVEGISYKYFTATGKVTGSVPNAITILFCNDDLKIMGPDPEDPENEIEIGYYWSAQYEEKESAAGATATVNGVAQSFPESGSAPEGNGPSFSALKNEVVSHVQNFQQDGTGQQGLPSMSADTRWNKEKLATGPEPELYQQGEYYYGEPPEGKVSTSPGMVELAGDQPEKLEFSWQAILGSVDEGAPEEVQQTFKFTWGEGDAEVENFPLTNIATATYSRTGWTVSNGGPCVIADGHYLILKAPLETGRAYAVAGLLLPVEFITPAGDPVNAPVEAPVPPDVGPPAPTPDGTNEFTFSNAATGVLTMKLKAKVPGIDAMPAAEQAKFTFEVDTIGNSTFAWDAANPGGKATVSGDFITATATYTRLPQNNSDFGLKKARVKHSGTNAGEAKFEVFFPRDATNHPSSSSNATWPNWMFYWMQTVTPLGTPAPTFKYGASSFFTPGTTEITLSPGDKGSYPAPYATTTPLEGIDNFAWTVIHESQHYKDWVDLWANNYTDWVNNRKGKTGAGDDKDGDRIPNSVEDVNLNGTYEAGDLYDWSTFNTPTPGRPASIINDFEDWDCQRNKTAKGDHSKDWSNPGMQHKTIDKYDD